MFPILILGSFLGGIVALFAPCCVTVLLPLYIGSLFRHTTKVFAMTGVFAAGLALVLIPITLGVGFLAELFHVYHQELYIFGGIIIALAGLATVMGIKMPIPHLKSPSIGEGNRVGWVGALLLGIFSGIASACCAPVLAGSITLALLSGSFWSAVGVSLFYILGMVAPLLVIALFWDKIAASHMQTIRVCGSYLKYVTGGLFLVVGIMLLYLGVTGNEWWAPQWQVGFAEWLKNVNTYIVNIIL